MALGGMLALAGCAAEKHQGPSRVNGQDKPFAKESERIAADPVAYLREVLARVDAIEQYRLTFYRQERFGLIPKLGPNEEIRAAFRKTPFSVKFEWDDPERDYFESVYVAGQNNNKLIVRERKGFLAFPPQVRMVNVQDPVTWGKSKNPITDFGLAQVTRRTLLPFDDPEVCKVMSIDYEGIVDLEPMHRPSHHIHIERPPMKNFRYTRQDYYLDAETMLPAGTDLFLASGDLDARYRYSNVDTNVHLTDADFRLSKGQPTTKPG